MYSRHTILLCVFSLAGCANRPPAAPPAPPATVTTVAAKCETPRQCEEVWIAAQEWIQTYSRMRLRIVTDTRLETFAANDYSRMTGVVVKYPEGNGSYSIRADFGCYSRTECASLRALAINGFNTMMESTVYFSADAKAKRGR